MAALHLILPMLKPLSRCVITKTFCSFRNFTRVNSDACKRTFYMETYGCQMNFSDSEIVHSILKSAGFKKVNDLSEADTALLLTCAIREGAEEKIWRRMRHFRSSLRSKHRSPLCIGILGCMAERLKENLLEGYEVTADFVCGPDAYRDLPKLIEDIQAKGLKGASLALSLEETYADVKPVRQFGPSAFISVMRGCDNMCSYCIVPFVRGRERSRPLKSIIEELYQLSFEGVKEVILLGQNVNSYRDLSEGIDSTGCTTDTLAPGFKTVYKQKVGGYRFISLLDAASSVDSNMRIRFTSPHPKDFNLEVLQLIAERPNVCSQLHLPAQSGSSPVLERMQRGYTREAYLELVNRAKSIIPNVAISSDFIAGFCGETEDDHNQTLSLIDRVSYAYGFCFPFSLRGKTRAFYRLEDDVPAEIKARRHNELKSALRSAALRFNNSLIGSTELVLVESISKRSNAELAGRVDGGVKVIFPKHLPDSSEIHIGDYVALKIDSCTSQTLRGTPLRKTNIVDFYKDHCARRHDARGS
ncbi:CDK5 regulatory subunit-associated protein 1 [Echinococcus granulosus]|uniref:Cdk5 regulatory subunit associated protein 1 n=1 Tax=Echinococcus granulosus TaxID=6210 RepID=A0A068WLL7_ECHGR|nr:CDK5 regulatory subunit-associated protein 1 [Echinococcus granulosus]CDS19334.1 cdk5 regulatory subunit associated protein 1 [Echinococcus granulosus]